MKMKKITSRALAFFSVSFAHRKPFDPPRLHHHCSATTFAVLVFLCRFEAIWIGFVVLS